MKKLYVFFLVLLLIPFLGVAQSAEKDQMDELFKKQQDTQEEARERNYISDNPFDKSIPQKANKQFQAFVYSYSQGVMQNFAAENEFLKGQIVGRLFGANTTTTAHNRTANYFEQRTLPFFVYSPAIFDGKFTLRAAFKIDYTWGDVAYGTGGNTGGALSGSQVNLQTQNIDIEYRFAPTWMVNVGLQRLYDNPNDLYRTLLDKMTHTGYRLAYWGTNGAGVSVRKDSDDYRLKFGMYQLYENNVDLVDDVILYQAMAEFNVSKNWNVGGSVFHLRDRSNGKGGVSILGQGPRSLLTDYNGAYHFHLGTGDVKTDVTWIGAFFSRNEDMMNDRYFLSGYVNSNLGRIDQNKGEGYKKAVDIEGFAANLRAGYRYGQTPNDAIIADLVYSSPNKNDLENGKYTGVITGNTWGSPVGLMIGQGSYLIFPHGNVVSRYTAAVSDLSNMGYGVSGVTLNASHDLIPYKLHAKIGGATAISNAKPKGGDSFIGWEINGKLAYELGPLITLEAHAAFMGLGDFYKSKDTNGNLDHKPKDPWTAFIGMKWLIF